MVSKSWFLLFFVFLAGHVSSQVDTLVRYTPNFQFKDGLYFSFEEFRDNCPGIKAKDILDKRGRPTNGMWTQHKKLYYMSQDTLRLLTVNDIWGYSDKGKVFLVRNGRQKRLQIIGAISHIVMVEEIEEFVDNDYGRGRFYTRPILREVNREYIIDIEQGEYIEFNVENFEDILSRDPVLYEEYSRVESRKVRSQLKFHYLTKYNKKHPVYFSVNQCVPIAETE